MPVTRWRYTKEKRVWGYNSHTKPLTVKTLYPLGLGITRYPTIRYYHDILPTITIISRYSDSTIIDILQEISPTIHHDICVTEEIQNLLQKHFMQSRGVVSPFLLGHVPQ